MSSRKGASMNAFGTRIAQEPTAVTTARFLSLLKRHGLEYGITYQWVGRCRHGIIEVFDSTLGPFDGAVACERFSRNTHLWTEADGRIGAMRTDSPKHLAVTALVATLED
jgi:hypothetical protein